MHLAVANSNGDFALDDADPLDSTGIAFPSIQNWALRFCASRKGGTLSSMGAIWPMIF